MTRWEGAVACPPGMHLPPPEVCTNLKKIGTRVKPIEVFDTPVDEFGIPDGHRLLALVAQTMDPSYQWPPGTNVHHLVYPRLSYTDELEH